MRSFVAVLMLTLPVVSTAETYGIHQESAATAPAEAWVVLVSGLAGEPRYATRFHDWCARLYETAASKWGIPADRIRWLSEDPARDADRITGRSTREGIESTLGDLAERVRTQDVVLVMLMGHGNGERLSLPGPDLDASEFALLLDQLRTPRVALVNTSSASGAFLPSIAAEGRVVISSTRSENVRNDSLFGGYLMEALEGEAADQDKDGRVSLLEAFEFARQETARYYERNNQLLSEHALLEDDGDGTGTLEPGAEGGDGLVARAFHMDVALAAAAVAADPRLAPVFAERDSVEHQIDELRTLKDNMEEEAYLEELETLLLRLAALNRRIRELGGGR